MARKTIGILGLGIFGSTIAETLSHYDCDIIAIDDGDVQVERVADLVTMAVVGDITDEDLLSASGISECNSVVIATGSSLEASVLAIIHCNKLGVPEIVAKSKSSLSTEILYKIGATRVISPEQETGRRVAYHILSSSVADVLPLDERVSVVEFFPPKKWVGKTIHALNLRQRYQMNVLGFRLKANESLNITFNGDTVITGEERIVALAEQNALDQLDFLNYL